MRPIRSSDPRAGDRVKITLPQSLWSQLEGTVRKVYRGQPKLMVSVVVHPIDASEFLRKAVPQHPVTNGYHTILTTDEFEILKRSIHT